MPLNLQGHLCSQVLSTPALGDGNASRHVVESVAAINRNRELSGGHNHSRGQGWSCSFRASSPASISTTRPPRSGCALRCAAAGHTYNWTEPARQLYGGEPPLVRTACVGTHVFPFPHWRGSALPAAGSHRQRGSTRHRSLFAAVSRDGSSVRLRQPVSRLGRRRARRTPAGLMHGPGRGSVVGSKERPWPADSLHAPSRLGRGTARAYRALGPRRQGGDVRLSPNRLDARPWRRAGI